LAHPFVDTLAVARRRFPGAPASLDALCRRFAIDLSLRDKHGAEIDCTLLAAVYIELLGGRQPGLDFAASNVEDAADMIWAPQNRPPRPARPHAPSIEELAAHQAMLAVLNAPLWLAAA
jgi:DNA polymerase-3 subunit epsilon